MVAIGGDEEPSFTACVSRLPSANYQNGFFFANCGPRGQTFLNQRAPVFLHRPLVYPLGPPLGAKAPSQAPLSALEVRYFAQLFLLSERLVLFAFAVGPLR